MAMQDSGDLDDSRRQAAARRSRRLSRASRPAGIGPDETPAAQGRTIYPRGVDPGRPAFVEQRERRRFAQRLADAQSAALLPEGRARHLVQRFPPLAGSGGLELYAGEGREELLAETYRVVIQQAPELVPTAEDLATAAGLGEESVIDLMLAEVDRDVRLLLDEPGAAGEDLVGARQILDALLMVADDGHAPGTRVRIMSGPAAGHLGTVVGALWGSIGAPVGYRVRDDGGGAPIGVATADLAVPVGQEILGR
jgi:hypothetical protein